eukprot:scaffold2456_cov129-Isochrysis_galbana.AAC.8
MMRARGSIPLADTLQRRALHGVQAGFVGGGVHRSLVVVSEAKEGVRIVRVIAPAAADVA